MGAAEAHGGEYPTGTGENGPPGGASQPAGADTVPVVDQDARMASADDKRAPEAMGAATAVPAELDVAHYRSIPLPEPRCWALVTAVYEDQLHTQPSRVRAINGSLREAARLWRVRLHKDTEGMEQLQQPRDLAVVLMWPTPARRDLHCGVYWRGSVLHATATGVQYEGIASLRDAYPVMEFWAK